MDEIKKLFQVKRIFAMILAAAMVITMMPTTANAASISGDAATQTQEADETSADTTVPDTDGSVVDESLQLDAVGETVWGFTDNRSDSDKTAVYGANPGDAGDPGDPQYFETGLSHIVITKDGSDYRTLWDDYECTQVWQKKTGTGNEDKDYTALGTGEYPTDAGEYKLVVTAPDGTKGDFIFTITAYEPKASLELGEIKAGTAKKDVKPESFISSLYFHNGEKDYNSGHYDDNGNYVYDYEKIYFTTTLDDDTVIGRDELIPETVNIAVAQIKDAITGEVLKDPDVLTKDQDYVIDLTLTFKDNVAKIYGTNYKLPGTISKLVTISDLIVPTVVVDLGEKQQVDADGKPVTDADGKPVMEDITELERTYTGEAVTGPDQTKEYTVKIQLDEQETDKDGKPVLDKDNNPVYKTIPVTAENLTASWYKGYNEYSDSNIVDGNKLDGAPTKVGDYTYLLTYEGQKGVYAKATAKIHVVVKPAVLTIKPNISDTTFKPGMTVKDVLSEVDYDVLKTDGTTFKIDRDRFWGNVNNTSVTQPYVPVFGVQVKEETSEAIPGESGETGTEPVDIYGNGTGNGEGYLPINTVLESGEVYRVVFTGYKAVYSASGSEYNRTEINNIYNESNDASMNTCNTGYQVDVTDETTVKNAVAVKMEKGKEAVISVDDILKKHDGKGATEENPITKVYDESNIYTKNVEYKLAVVTAKDGNATIAQKASSAIDYTWKRGVEVPVYDDQGNQTGTKIEYNGEVRGISPVNAGKYCLEISYIDSMNPDKTNRGYYAEPVKVYYEIQPQLVRIKLPSTESYDTMTGITVRQYLSFVDTMHEVYKISEDRKTETKLDWPTEKIGSRFYNDGYYEYYDSDEVYYQLYWYVEKEVNGSWGQQLELTDVFEKGVKYRLRVAFIYPNDNYTDCEEIIENQKPQLVDYNEAKTINVAEMGTTELAIVTDPAKLTLKSKIYDGTAYDVATDIKNGLVSVVRKDDGKTVVTDAQVLFVWVDEVYGDVVENPVDAGTYHLTAFFMGDTKYKALDNLLLDTGITFEIEQRELTVKPAVKEPVVAGTYSMSVSDYAKTTFENVAPGEEAAFEYDYVKGIPAVDVDEDGNESYSTAVYDAEGKPYYGKLKGNTEYTLKCTDLELKDLYARNYTFKSDEVKFTVVRGNSEVEGIYYYSIPAYKLDDVKTNDTHTITAKEGIQYLHNVRIYNRDTYNYEYLEGNLVALRITVPAEYNYLSDAEAIYENSIKNAGGRVVRTGSNYIYVVFDAADGKEKPIEFTIRWEEGYVEHFKLDFSKADLLEDLRKAVAPKSLSFNKPDKKMVVGGTQALDVKITSSQIGDLIHLSYEVDNDKVLCVDDRGNVTALATGDATVTVRSTRLDENGEYVSTTPEKKATVKIKVSDVTAPKIKKIDKMTDARAYVYYSQVNDGYRREIYVLEGKTNYTADDFEDKISFMKNGNWEAAGFAIAPIYCGSNSEWYDTKAKLNYRSLQGLKTDREYTVYVRNVSRIRTLADGCEVAESYNGSVKGFKTTKPQITGIELEFKDEGVEYGWNNSVDDDVYSVELKKGTTMATVSGGWLDDAGDWDWKELSLSKEDQKNYVNPKLEFYVGERVDRPYSEYRRDYDNSNVIQYIEDYYDEDTGEHRAIYITKKTSLASIDKKGKLKLNGVGVVDVYVRDSNTGIGTIRKVAITATADDIVGKNVKLQVGQRIKLEDLLTYKEGKKVLIGDFASKVVLDEALQTAIDNSESFELQEGYVVAVKAGDLSLTLGDAYVGKTATAKLKATALEPVKNLKTTTVTDQHFDIEFTHSLKPGTDSYTDGLGFRIKVTDARGTLLRSSYVKASDVYNTETQKYEYRMTGLTKKSKYNVVVTAEFKNETSKETRKPVTTTLLPASYYVAPDKLPYEYNYYNEGIGVYVHGSDSAVLESSDNEYGGYTYSFYPFRTGNSYTLEVGNVCGNGMFNVGAKAAMTDTLTWTSSNTKVATIKANAGSYSASLKAVGQGYTTIEVKSKITKAVIARYSIRVSTVGNAYDYDYNYAYYYGEDEYLESETVSSVMSYALKNGTATLR